MKTREDYNRALHVIAAVVNAWDPYSLLAGGAPPDEFDSEVARLATRIPHIHCADDAPSEISAVFSDHFSPEDFPVDSCADVGAKLFQELQRAHLLPDTKV